MKSLIKKLSSIKGRKRLNKEDGFTLIEVLASLVILSIILITFFSFFNQALLFSSKNEDRLVAYNLARKTLNIVTQSHTNVTEEEITISCETYPIHYSSQLIAVLEPANCYYKVNEVKYFPEITIRKQTYPEITNTTLYIVHVKIYSSNVITDRKLLSETFGYVRGGTT